MKSQQNAAAGIPRFSCSPHLGLRAVKTDSIKEAALLFANRAARKKYGRRGYARTCQQGAISVNRMVAEYSAFIGYTTGRNETTGNNINFSVFVESD